MQMVRLNILANRRLQLISPKPVGWRKRVSDHALKHGVINSNVCCVSRITPVRIPKSSFWSR
jgi:hypothetical protein